MRSNSPTLADLPRTPRQVARGQRLMQTYFGHEFTNLGIVAALLGIVADPVVLVSLQRHGKLGDLSVSKEKWTQFGDKRRSQAPRHINEILAFVQAAVFGHPSLDRYIELVVITHANLDVRIPNRIGSTRPGTYKVSDAENMFFVLSRIMYDALEAYSHYVKLVTDKDREAYYAAVCEMAVALQIDLSQLKVTGRAADSPMHVIEMWVTDREAYLEVTDDSRNVALNLIDSGWIEKLVPHIPAEHIVTLVRQLLGHRIAGGTYDIEGVVRVEGYGLTENTKAFDAAKTVLGKLLRSRKISPNLKTNSK